MSVELAADCVATESDFVKGDGLDALLEVVSFVFLQCLQAQHRTLEILDKSEAFSVNTMLTANNRQKARWPIIMALEATLK